jgi:small subunit ribosomal protein S21
MSQVLIAPGEFDFKLKQFNRKVQNAGILAEARRRRFHEDRQTRRKRKAEAQRRRRSHSR